MKPAGQLKPFFSPRSAPVVVGAAPRLQLEDETRSKTGDGVGMCNLRKGRSRLGRRSDGLRHERRAERDR